MHHFSNGTSGNLAHTVRASTVAVATIATLLLSPTSHGASTSALQAKDAAAWWRGTITLTERWTIAAGDLGAYRGEASVKIVRTAPESARYEVRYLEEYDYGGCSAYRRTNGSWSGTGPIQVKRLSSTTFVVYPRDSKGKAVSFSVNVEERTGSGCTASSPTQRAFQLKPMMFTTTEPPSATRRKGSRSLTSPLASSQAYIAGIYFNRNHSGVNGTTTMTWDLELIGGSSAPTTTAAALQMSGPTLKRQNLGGGRGQILAVVEVRRPGYSGIYRLQFNPLCRSSISGDPSFTRGNGSGLAVPGRNGVAKAYCSFPFNAVRHKGMTMRGRVIVIEGRKEYTRSFRVRL